jgi:hypothetical protein
MFEFDNDYNESDVSNIESNIFNLDIENSEEPEVDEEENDVDFLNELLYGEEIENENETEESKVQRSKPLEDAIRWYCIISKFQYGIQYLDLSNIRNFKNRKGQREVDFVIEDIAAIEAKNWDCIHRKYSVSMSKINGEIMPRFKKYPNIPKKILIISDPIWPPGTKEYLKKEGIDIIELGFMVTYDEQIFFRAFDIIKSNLDNLLSIPNRPTE